ncbi:thiol:disulfide interchange protein DsbE [Vibrio fortis]|uniref:Thiol:disulfide interchange protein DsbE n=1 Tax=Vibrio fortis TaxID=212667 RepID=A0A066US55_9VIBR|nr:DsbE family thiol:disulfide interchange protein [Vibrio fortis]KDN30256.1 thiol:disulfide interchange protein DsbE [Vibrio fortis]
MKSNVRNKMVMLFAITIVVMVVFGLALGKKQQVSVTDQHTRDFPEFSLASLSMPVGSAVGGNAPVTLTREDVTAHPYQLVNVWASWCGICKQEHPVLLKLADSDVPIIGLNYRDTAAAAIKELQTSGNPYHQVISDPNGQLALDLGVIGTPETYLVDQQGRVVKKLVGAMTQEVWQEEFADYFKNRVTL